MCCLIRCYYYPLTGIDVARWISDHGSRVHIPDDTDTEEHSFGSRPPAVRNLGGCPSTLHSPLRVEFNHVAHGQWKLELNSIRDAPTGVYFDADRPIEFRDQDRLGRRSFAEVIARQVRAVPAERGFTIAVAGEWGSGKTSVLNMVAEALQEDGDAIAVLRFNPWLFSNADDLVIRFFRELSAQLGQDRLKG